MDLSQIYVPRPFYIESLNFFLHPDLENLWKRPIDVGRQVDMKSLRFAYRCFISVSMTHSYRMGGGMALTHKHPDFVLSSADISGDSWFYH